MGNTLPSHVIINMFKETQCGKTRRKFSHNDNNELLSLAPVQI